MLKPVSILLLISFFLLGCDSQSRSSASGSQTGETPDDVSTPVAQGSRVLGMDVKETPSIDYVSAYNQAMNLGVREVSVSLDWALLEPSVGNYDNTLPDIMDAFYSAQAAYTTLVLRPLDTPGSSMPEGLADRGYDDAEVITAFENFLTNLHGRLTTLNASGKLKWIHIGNEIDAYLGNDETRWSQWQVFFRSAKAKVRELWGDSVEVSSIVQFSVLDDTSRKALYFNLLDDLDNAVFTYYPLNDDFTMRPVSTVATDFKTLVEEIPDKDILLQECGYPSGESNNSSEAQQADFIDAVFAAWDDNRERIPMIDLTWQYDVADATVDQWVEDYGMSGNTYEAAFRSYLATLGLGNEDGTEKQAMSRLRQALEDRAWGQ